MLNDIIVIVIGLVSSYIIFRKFPVLQDNCATDSKPTLSIIIPARNE